MWRRTLVRSFVASAVLAAGPVVANGAFAAGNPARATERADVVSDTDSHGVWAAVAAIAALAASGPAGRRRRP